MPRDTGQFKVKERVLVSFTDQKYEAKIVKAEKQLDGLFTYFIHYPGWNKSHDEWVPATDLCKYDESQVNAKLPSALPPAPSQAADLTDAQDPQVKSVSTLHAPPVGKPALHQQSAAAQPKQRSSDKRPKKRPRTAPETATTGFDADTSSQIDVDLPLSLKRVLLEEHNTLSLEDRLPHAPHHPSVVDILSFYTEYSRSKEADSYASEMASGIQDYFDKALPQLLLYDEELDDYKDASEEVPPSHLYGGHHLLRLLVKLPDILPAYALPASSHMNLQLALSDLVTYLQDNAAQFLPATAERL